MLGKRMLVLLALAMSLGVWQFTIRARGAAPASSLASPILTGTTQAVSGAPLEGVAVTARLMDKTYQTTVYTDEQGRYVFPPLASGQYRMWAQAVGYATSRAELNLDAARANTQAFALKPMADFSNQLNSAEWLAALPENTVNDRRMKEVLRHNCTQCHQLNFALLNRFDEAGWRVIVNLMERISVYGAMTAPVNAPDDKLTPDQRLIRYHKDELVAYLTKWRGPNSPPLNFKPLPRPKGDSARVAITEYDIPLAENPTEWHAMDGSDWSEGAPQMQQNAVHDAYADHYGNVWLTVGYANRNVSFYKLDPKTGQVTGYKMPTPDGKFARSNHGLTRDTKGFIWTDQQEESNTPTFKGLLRIDPKTEEMTIFYPPRMMKTGTSISVDFDAKGKIWAATQYGQIAFDPATQKFSYFANPSSGNGGVYGETGDVDGNGWVSQQSQDSVVKADYKTGKSQEVVIPPRKEIQELFSKEEREWYTSMGALDWGGMGNVPWAEYTRRLGADKNKPSVYVPLWWGESLAQIDIRTLKVNYHKLPVASFQPYFAVVDKNSNVWTNLMSDDRVAKLDPKTGQYTIYNLPSRGTVTRNTNVDDYQKDPEVWQAYWGTNRVARLQFRTEAELKAVK